MLKRYGEELQSVFDELIRMASYAVGAVRKAHAALERGDAAAAKNIVEGDENVNRFEKEIEQRALRIIIKYQPVANDLRDVTGALKMITDIERIGDQAADIASVFLKIGEAVKGQRVRQRRPQTRRKDDRARRSLGRDVRVDQGQDVRKVEEPPGRGGKNNIYHDDRKIPRADRRPRGQHLRVGGLRKDGSLQGLRDHVRHL